MHLSIFFLISIVKIVLSIALGRITYRTIDISQDPHVGIILFTIISLLFTWGTIFLILYPLQNLLLRVKCNIAALSYKQSCVLSIFTSSTLLLLALNARNIFIGIFSFSITIGLIYIISRYDISKIRY